MSISIDEDLLTLADAAKILPRRRRGRKVAVSTLYRWARHGMKGVRLEVVQVGGTTCTSRSALQRFFDQLTSATHPASQTAPHINPAKDERVVERRLDDFGI